MPQPKIVADQIDLDTVHVTGVGMAVQSVYGTIVPANGVTVIPHDTTIPLITEGTNIGSGPITPQRTTSGIKIEFSITVDSDTNSTDVVVAVFRDTTCVVSAVVTIDTTTKHKSLSLHFVDAPATTSEVTYSGRVGVGVVGPTWYINSVADGDDMGGTLKSSFILSELV